jgi:hypothetical protein
MVSLCETGSASFDVILFDVACPGPYKRLIESVRVTIAGVVGPYTTVGRSRRRRASTVEITLVVQLKLHARTTGLFWLFSLRHDFPSSWYQLMGERSA